MIVFRAQLETRNFTFEAFGESEAAARQALVEGFAVHARQRHLPSRWWQEFAVDVEVLPLVIGSCYRDKEMLL